MLEITVVYCGCSKRRGEGLPPWLSGSVAQEQNPPIFAALMTTKIFRAVWFFSLLAVTAALLYGYASLPENVIVQDDGVNLMQITRDTFFYIVLGLLAVINVLVFFIAQIAVKNKPFQNWFYGLIVTFNIFFIVGISFIWIYNSGEHYDYTRLETTIYGSIAVFCCWTVGWPLYWGYTRIVNKS